MSDRIEATTWRRDTPAIRRMQAEEVAVTDATELVSLLLELRDVTRSDLAERLDVSRSEVTQRLNGKRNLTVKSLASMLHELGYRLQLGYTDLAAPAQTPSTDVAAATPARAFHLDTAPARESGARYTQSGTRISAVPGSRVAA